MIGITQHLTKDQLKARAARQNCGKPGRRKGEPWTPRRRDRARSEPSLAPVPAEVLTPWRADRVFEHLMNNVLHACCMEQTAINGNTLITNGNILH